MLIEKMGDKYVPDVACMPKLYGNFSFSALKLGCLLVGMGLGLFGMELILSVWTIRRQKKQSLIEQMRAME